MVDFRKFVNISLLILSIFLNICLKDAVALSSKKITQELGFHDEKGELLTLENYEDNVVILHFWATWCQHCIGEMQIIDKLQKEYRKKPLKVLAISEDYKGISIVQDFFKAHKITHLIPLIDNKNLFMKELNVSSIPTSIIVSKEGREIERFAGEVDWENEEVRKIIDYELAK
ncbi:MAG: TlpA family protein disulfide reductase [Sphingobacteriia bacterium]|nr:TlpA family protein disulfide reductase [Sphingobacteriia bacterium]